MDSSLMIFDVTEKEVSEAKAPSFPQPKPTATGFPEHKKRTRVSAFKKQRQSSQRDSQDGGEASDNAPASFTQPQGDGVGTYIGAGGEPPRPHFDSERRRIDKENREKLAAMSSSEIADAQKELFSSLDPEVLQMLLRRANLDVQPDGPNPFEADSTSGAAEGSKSSAPDKSAKAAAESDLLVEQLERLETGDRAAPSAEGKTQGPKKTVSFAATVEDEIPEPPAAATPAVPAADEQPRPPQPTNSTHFPKAPGPPELDPADPNFLEALHDKYFPNLPADPAKLAWMAPIPTEDSPADRESPYYPGQASLAVSQLRFDFRGSLLPPSLSRRIPTTKGLHHHAEAPEAAGYTVVELARLARSAVPAQRCIAFQTLGRILFRLGQGEWGSGAGSMGMGIFRCVSEGRVLDSLNEAAAVEEGRGHRGSRAYAIEALWLYEKGGWKASFSGR